MDAVAEKLIDWSKITKAEALIIRDIVKRALKMNPNIKALTLDMDISACHIANPLKLHELLKADDFNFSHDVFGISRNMNRMTGELENCFSPRYSI